MFLIEENTLSKAWLAAFKVCYGASGKTVSPISVSFPVDHDNFDIEVPFIRAQLDEYMRGRKLTSIATVTGRTKIKQKYNFNSSPINYFYPPKWGINDKVNETVNN